MNGRKYEFSWDLLGDIPTGRPNLGSSTHVGVYRLMQFTFRDVLESRFGSQVADELFYQAGYLSGNHFFENVIGSAASFDDFIRRLEQALKEMHIGILRIEETDPANGRYVLTVSEDLDCSGLPELDYEICTYDEGFIAGLFKGYLGIDFQVKEVDCWCTGDRTCRFVAQKIPGG